MGYVRKWRCVNCNHIVKAVHLSGDGSCPKCRSREWEVTQRCASGDIVALVYMGCLGIRAGRMALRILFVGAAASWAATLLNDEKVVDWLTRAFRIFWGHG